MTAGARPGVTEVLRALPDLARLLARLVLDPRLPRAVKLLLAAAAVYLASPVDLLPDVVPVLGWIDDVLVGAVVLDGILNWVDRRLILRYWPGSPASLDRVARAARLLAMWVPRRVKARVFATR